MESVARAHRGAHAVGGRNDASSPQVFLNDLLFLAVLHPFQPLHLQMPCH